VLRADIGWTGEKRKGEEYDRKFKRQASIRVCVCCLEYVTWMHLKGGSKERERKGKGSY
jgi:hypothetical protein